MICVKPYLKHRGMSICIYTFFIHLTVCLFYKKGGMHLFLFQSYGSKIRMITFTGARKCSETRDRWRKIGGSCKTSCFFFFFCLSAAVFDLEIQQSGSGSQVLCVTLKFVSKTIIAKLFFPDLEIIIPLFPFIRLRASDCLKSCYPTSSYTRG